MFVVVLLVVMCDRLVCRSQILKIKPERGMMTFSHNVDRRKDLCVIHSLLFFWDLLKSKKRNNTNVTMRNNTNYVTIYE